MTMLCKCWEQAKETCPKDGLFVTNIHLITSCILVYVPGHRKHVYLTIFGKLSLFIFCCPERNACSQPEKNIYNDRRKIGGK